MGWLDHPFYDLLSQITTLMPYFMRQARFIGYVLIGLNVSLTGIKFAISHQGLKEDLLKIVKAYMLLLIILHAYPALVMGMNRLSYSWTMTSCNTPEFQKMVESTRTDPEFWNEKADPDNPAWSSLVKEVKTVGDGGEIGKEYVLDIQLGETGYFSPTSIMRLIGMIMENIWHATNRMDRNSFGVPKDLTMYVLSLLTAILVLLCGIFAALQYFITVLEFAFITSIGIVFLPGMCLTSTKFITEKFFGCLFGFFVKLLFVSIAMMLTFGGYIGLLTKVFSGTIDQIIYIVFTALFYMMICQSGPQLAASLLTGSPQMSLGELAAAGGAFIGAAIGAKKVGTSVASGAVKGATKTAGEIAKAGSAAKATRTLTSSKDNPKGSNKEAVAAFAGSLMNSAGQATKSKLHGAGNSLKQSSAGKAGNGKNATGNRFSQTGKMNEKKSDGNNKTTKEYLDERKTAGEDYAINRLAKKEAKQSKNKPTTNKPTQPSRLALPPPEKLALPPPGLPAPNKRLPPPKK
jgi:hypothetical protein